MNEVAAAVLFVLVFRVRFFASCTIYCIYDSDHDAWEKGHFLRLRAYWRFPLMCGGQCYLGLGIMLLVFFYLLAEKYLCLRSSRRAKIKIYQYRLCVLLVVAMGGWMGHDEREWAGCFIAIL